MIMPEIINYGFHASLCACVVGIAIGLYSLARAFKELQKEKRLAKEAIQPLDPTWRILTNIIGLPISAVLPDGRLKRIYRRDGKLYVMPDTMT